MGSGVNHFTPVENKKRRPEAPEAERHSTEAKGEFYERVQKFRGMA